MREGRWRHGRRLCHGRPWMPAKGCSWILDEREGPESRNIWEVTSAELGDCGWMGMCGRRFPSLSVSQAEGRAWDQDLMDGENSLWELRLYNPPGLSSNPSSIIYKVGHLEKWFNLSLSFHTCKAKLIAYSSRDCWKSTMGQSIQSATSLGTMETEVPLQSCLWLTSPKFNNTDNLRLTSRLHPPNALKDTKRMRLSSRFGPSNPLWSMGWVDTAS